MDKRTRALFSSQIYQEALVRFGITPHSVHELGGFESFLYEYQQDGTNNILRISHSLHHPPNRTRGEMDFLNYLSQNGLAVPRPILSLAGNLVEVIEAPSPDLPEGSFFSVVSFDKAPGGPPRKEDWNPVLFNKMGRFMGRLHSLSKNYQPGRPEYRRHAWYEDEEDYAVRYLPSSETRITEKFAQLVAYLKAFPRDPQGYGLNHVDFHGGNFFVHHEGDELQITLFDFDDCAYAPFVYDIAMALFYAVPHHCDTPADLQIARTFYHAFMEGYRLENQLDPAWLKEIPYFLKLREMDLYIIIHRSFDISNLGPWEASFMDGRKERLENDIPYIAIDFD
ncbi:MAG: hypothetical protein EHM21_18620 [Chloroflexi bacterium]|nr:MAG: hypothetical protein EHM21_18620 [Chloroflexota bacterium]